MLHNIIECVKDPKKIHKTHIMFKELSDNEKHSVKDLSNTALKIIIEIYKCSKNPLWSQSINEVLICDTISKICHHIKQIDDASYQNYIVAMCNIHRYVLKKDIDKNAPSFFPKFVFTNTHLSMVPKYAKMYWIMIVDKINFLETKFLNVINMEDLNCLHNQVKRLIKIADISQICNEYVPYIIRKYFKLFSMKFSHDLESIFEEIFQYLLQSIDQEMLGTKFMPDSDMYKNLLSCVHFLLENSILCNSNMNKSFTLCARFLKSIYKNNIDILYQLESLNLCSSIFKNRVSINFHLVLEKLNTRLNHMLKKPLDNLDQFIFLLKKIFSLYVDKWIKSDLDNADYRIPTVFKAALINVIITMMNCLGRSNEQSIQCDNCNFKSGIHDAIQLGILIHSMFAKSIKNNTDVSEIILPYMKLFDYQTECVMKLCKNNCLNSKQIWISMEKHFHSNAILLHSTSCYSNSLKIFNSYFQNSIKIMKNCSRHICIENLSRAYYNCSISQLDMLKFKPALRSCYLSMILNATVGTEFDQNTTQLKCIIQIKTKAQEKGICSGESFKSDYSTENKHVICECYEDVKNIQEYNVWKMFCRLMNDKSGYVFHEIIRNIDIGRLLLCELEAYNMFWFSTLPVVKICESLKELYMRQIHENQSMQKCLEYEKRKTLLCYCGFAVTLISVKSGKLCNKQIMSFIKFTIEIFEDFFLDHNEQSHFIYFLKLLFGNSFKAYYECIVLEKLQNEPPPSLLTTSNVSKGTPHVSVDPNDVCDIAPNHQSLTFSFENNVINILLKAVQIWQDVLKHIDCNFVEQYYHNRTYKPYIEKTVEIMFCLMQAFALRRMDVHILKVADITLSFALLMKEKVNILLTVGFVIEHIKSQNSKNDIIIDQANKIAQEILNETAESSHSSQLKNATLDYLLSLSMYYFNIDLKDKGFVIFMLVRNKILKDNFKEDEKNTNSNQLIFVKLLHTQSMYLNHNDNLIDNYGVDSVSVLTNAIHTYSQASKLITSVGKYDREHILALGLWIDCGRFVGELAFLLGLPRHARSILKHIFEIVQRLLLPRLSIEFLILLANIDIQTERFDDCNVKIDSINYIMGETDRNILNMSTKKKTISEFNEDICKSDEQINSFNKQIEMVLDIPMNKYSSNDLGGSPVFHSSPFVMPNFIDHHHSCICMTCSSITMFNLFLSVTHLKAVLYFKTKDRVVTHSFIDGALKLSHFLNYRLKYLLNNHFDSFSNLSCDKIVDFSYYNHFAQTEISLYIDASYYFASENDNCKAETLNQQAFHLCSFLSTDSNLMQQKVYEQKLSLMYYKISSKEKLDIVETLNDDFTNLKVTPKKFSPNSFKTPCAKVVPKFEDTKVKKLRRNASKNLSDCFDNEMPEIVRPVIKLILDEDNDLKTPNQKKKIPSNRDNIENTPAPKINIKQPYITPLQTKRKEKRTNEDSTSKFSINKDKSRLLRSVSPGSLDTSEIKSSANRITRNSARNKK